MNISKIINNEDRMIYLLIFLSLPSIFILFEAGRLINDVFIILKMNQTLVESYKKVWGKNQVTSETVE
jgi:hypothetical protein